MKNKLILNKVSVSNLNFYQLDEVVGGMRAESERYYIRTRDGVDNNSNGQIDEDSEIRASCAYTPYG